MSENSGGSYCSKLTDAQIMRIKLEDNTCQLRDSVNLSELKIILREECHTEPSIDTILSCRNYLSSCQRCRFYRGDYPTWDEIKNQF